MRGAYFAVSHSEASGNRLISRNKKVTLHAMSISHIDNCNYRTFPFQKSQFHNLQHHHIEALHRLSVTRSVISD